MEKLILIKEHNFAEVIEKAVEVLRRGGVIGYPTETVYGLGARISAEEAVIRIRRLKGKEEPILVLVSGMEMVERYVEVDERAKRLMRRFWPGPLTLVLKAKSGASGIICAGREGLGVRRSSDPVAQALVERLGEPITSTSANRSGQEPITSAKEIEKELGEELDLILDGGLRKGLASTVIDLTGAQVELIREGPIKWDEIKLVLEWQG